MNDKEKQVIDMIKANPYLSQQEMATQLNISRPALANIISGLMKKGEIVGRAYILPKKDAIVVIGGANVDRKFHLNNEVRYGTSNIASSHSSVGGVARNIAENLGRLGNSVKLITIMGNDQDAYQIEQESSTYINFDLVEKRENETTGSYTAILSNDGELILGLANMAIYDSLIPAVLEKHESTLINSKCIVVDLNCPKETVEYLKNIAEVRNVPFAIVPVSSPKMKNMPSDLKGVTYFICNLEEVEMYLNGRIESLIDCEVAVKQLLELGAENVVLTMGDKGVYIGNYSGRKHLEAVKVNDVVDVTGAGDAFVGATLHGVLNGDSFEDAVQLGLYNASKTLESDKTVRNDLSAEELYNWRNL
ncbi:carbohydrate kinase [Ureibacillus massiliensis 4400831 = CIP 108448 = CCUG 49529]|uniref:Carbohydrate kinase n=1 Tax=Ureibacillus massiliensis 4400831 = CIP 108448 = CCUG 49529 TaxID=1211035 RepID=A0A0A3IZ51_9BACL|nr:PfkB family carbohydrate kinase [Ureibacillus massiliensis]KGR89981.1 carbohydrate kinase [Ureibacillus massiliensis 4400831 = CIP 108448 = CCUG 49529]